MRKVFIKLPKTPRGILGVLGYRRDCCKAKEGKLVGSGGMVNKRQIALRKQLQDVTSYSLT